MYLSFLACVLLQAPGAMVQPACPDHKALLGSALTHLPTPLEKLPAEQRAEMEARLAEATTLCKFMPRVWNHLALESDNASLLLNALTVLQQFDTALQNLNPNPTVMEAVARVRAYRVWFTVIQRGIESAHARGDDVRDLEQRYRFWRKRIEEAYRPLFARAL